MTYKYLNISLKKILGLGVQLSDRALRNMHKALGSNHSPYPQKRKKNSSFF
jgi:hypothetical protein